MDQGISEDIPKQKEKEMSKLTIYEVVLEQEDTPKVEFPVQAWDATGTRKVVLKGPISPYMIRNHEDED